MTLFVCSFSGAAADLKRGHRTPEHVLAAIAEHPRISTFDFSEKAWLWRAVKDLKERGLIEAIEEPYPWHRYRVTEAGKKAMGEKQ